MLKYFAGTLEETYIHMIIPDLIQKFYITDCVQGYE